MSVFSDIGVVPIVNTYGLSFDDLIEVRAAARNAFGWSDVSAENTGGARVRSVPN
jgi:hypothetical protein